MVVGNFWCDADIIRCAIDTDVIKEVTIDEWGIGKQFVVEKMVPAESRCFIAPIETETAGERHQIRTWISGEKNPVLIV